MKLHNILKPIALSALAAYTMTISAQEQPVPRVRFAGDEFADKASVIFAETLQDMRNKIEDGTDPKFPLGFFHTSTEEAGVPQYYNDMWARDVGRGVTELSRLGFAQDALNISRYLLSHISMGNHWGREVHQRHISQQCELDGNALILTRIDPHWNMRHLECKRKDLRTGQGVLRRHKACSIMDRLPDARIAVRRTAAVHLGAVREPEHRLPGI